MAYWHKPRLEANLLGFDSPTGALLERYEKVKRKLVQISDQKQQRSEKRERIAQCLKMLERNDILQADFDEGSWYTTVDGVTAFSEHYITLTFKDGTELP